MKTFHIYALVNSRTLDAYVGYSWQPPGQRLSKHLKELMEGAHHCSKLQEAWNNYGSECFQFTVLVELGEVTREFAKAIEGVLIGKLGTYNEMVENKWSDAMREKRREHSNRMWSDPDRRAEHGRLIKTVWADPERRQSYANRRSRWADPEQSSKHSETMKALWADTERRQRLEARRVARWADPQAKARQSEKMRSYHAARRARLQDV